MCCSFFNDIGDQLLTVPRVRGDFAVIQSFGLNVII